MLYGQLMSQRPTGAGPRSERLSFGGGVIVVRAGAEETGGALTVFEEVPPLLDTPVRELAEADRAGKLGPEAYAAASERFGIRWL